MNRLAHRVRTATSIASLTLAAMTVATPFAAASGSGVPFNDANVDGSLTFCSRTGQPVTSGSLNTVPFVWKAISSSPAPKAYRVAGAKTTLTAYQPIKYVDPGDWSGGQLTGSSTFTNPSHPVAQATNGDGPLLNFVQAYPPHWAGLVEIRMFFSGVNLPQDIAPYPAAVVRVTGSTWTLVSGGGGTCSAGTGVSDETVLLPKKKLASPETIVPAGSSSSAPASQASGGSSADPGSSSVGGGAAPGGGTAVASDAASSGLSAGAKTGIGLGVVAVLGALAIGGAWWRRRPGEGH